MAPDRLAASFPDFALMVSELGMSLVLACHGPNLQQMQSKVSAAIEDALVQSPFVSDSREYALAQENMLREIISKLIESTYDADPQVMVSRFQQLIEAMPEMAPKVAREQIAALKRPFWNRLFRRTGKLT